MLENYSRQMMNLEPRQLDFEERTQYRASILIIYTGGTLGMDYDENGSLSPGDFDHILSKLPVLKELHLKLSVVSFEKPIDSSNIQPGHWADLALIIKKNYDRFDGFIVLHGTDTMAYSASALSFMLRGLNKPVVFTGAQLPIGLPRSDARENFITALEIASDYRDGQPVVPEVCIFFNHLLIRGNRAKKVESAHFDAFESENHPILAEAGIVIDYHYPSIKKVDQRQLQVNTQMEQNIALLKLFPGITKTTVQSILGADHLQGVVLESYGSGNVPHEDWFLDCLKEATGRGLTLLNVSQCNGGRVMQGKYQTSSALNAIGVINGADLTTEAAVTKMMFVLAQSKSVEEIKKMLISPLAGEISRPN